MIAVEECSVTLSHGRTRYLQSGDGEAVLLLHGAGFAPGADSWRLALPVLADGYRVIAPDVLGWGPGDQLDIDYSFAYMVDSLREFQDALGLDRSHVVAQSMGGWLASILAYESPARVGSLVLISSGGLRTVAPKGMADWHPPSPEVVIESLRPLEDHGVDIAPLVAHWSELAADPERAAGFRRVMANMAVDATRRRYGTERRLPHIRNPTLLIWGSADPVNPVELGRRTADLIAGAELVVLDGVGHNVPMERPDELAALVRTFLDRATRTDFVPVPTEPAPPG
jgi:pimeloyl-ACP methyl ester carboxylesterase